MGDETVILAGVDDPTTVQPLAVPGRHRRGGMPAAAETSIFLDGTGRRKRRLVWALALTGVGGLAYTVALAATMLGGVEADSVLPRPGQSAAPSAPSPVSPSSAPTRSASRSPSGGSPPGGSPAVRAPRGPAPEVQAPATRSTRATRTASPSQTRSAPPPTVAPTVPTASPGSPGSFWSRLFPSPGA